jgi:hypothetical protein
MPNKNRPSFDIPPLPEVGQILSDDLGFLKYSTQKRNVAYLWQFLEFQKSLFDRYYTYGSVRKSMIRSIVLTTTNIIEYLLYASVRQEGREAKHSLRKLINNAATFRLIDDNLKVQLHELRELRNRIHPDNQTEELDYDSFQDSQVNWCVTLLTALKKSLADHFEPSEVLTEPARCP